MDDPSGFTEGWNAGNEATPRPRRDYLFTDGFQRWANGPAVATSVSRQPLPGKIVRNASLR